MVFTFSRDEEITVEVVEDFINKHKAEIPRYQRLKKMYESNPPITEQKKKPEHKPDNRLVVNFAKYIVDTFNGYFIGIPVKVTHDDKEINDRVDDFIRRNDMEDNEAELSKLCSIYGHAYEYLYQNRDSETCCIYNDPFDMIVVYDDTIAQEPLFAVQYQKDDKTGWKGLLFTETEEIELTTDKDKKLTFGKKKPHYYGGLPIIEYIENEERQSTFEAVESLINAYDKAVSEKANDVDYFADAYMKILGAKLEDEDLKHIRDNRIINLFGGNTEEIKKLIVEFMEKPNGDQNQENLLDRLERLIFQMSMVANINDESFGNASGVALEFKLQPMKNLAAMKERKFKASMKKRYKMVFNLPTNIPASKKDKWFELNYQFTRNIPRNVADEAEVAGSLQGIVSKETQLSVLSIVDNPKDEMERMVQEEGKSPHSVNSFGGDRDFRELRKNENEEERE